MGDKNDPESSDTVGMLFTNDQKLQQAKMDITPDKIVVTKDQKRSEFNSISEIFGEKVEFDMSTIKEMVESLEEDSLHFRANSRSEMDNKSFKLTPRGDQSQNSFEKIIKYMKTEITKIDQVKRKERDKGIISTKMETNSPEYGGRTKKKSENISLGRVKFFRVSFSMAKLVLAP